MKEFVNVAYRYSEVIQCKVLDSISLDHSFQGYFKKDKALKVQGWFACQYPCLHEYKLYIQVTGADACGKGG